FELYERFTDLDIEGQLTLVSQICSLLIGPVVIVLLARKGVARTPAAGPWGGGGPWDGGGPWGAQQPGYPPPQTAPGQQPPAPGFGPPPSTPPPRW
ncbi:hypothetical protein ACFV0W_24375, partial [Streptomyces anulatus]